MIYCITMKGKKHNKEGDMNTIKDRVGAAEQIKAIKQSVENINECLEGLEYWGSAKDTAANLAWFEKMADWTRTEANILSRQARSVFIGGE
jgi:hypothetical protein